MRVSWSWGLLQSLALLFPSLMLGSCDTSPVSHPLGDPVWGLMLLRLWHQGSAGVAPAPSDGKRMLWDSFLSLPACWQCLRPGSSCRVPSPQEGVGPGALPAPLAPAAHQREEPPEIPLAAAQSPPAPAWRHQGEPSPQSPSSALVGWQPALHTSLLSPAARELLLLNPLGWEINPREPGRHSLSRIRFQELIWIAGSAARIRGEIS